MTPGIRLMVNNDLLDELLDRGVSLLGEQVRIRCSVMTTTGSKWRMNVLILVVEWWQVRVYCSLGVVEKQSFPMVEQNKSCYFRIPESECLQQGYT
jgi:predicted thioesterase